MSQTDDPRDTVPHPDDAPADPTRRRLLVAGVGLAGLSLGGCNVFDSQRSTPKTAADLSLDRTLQAHVRQIVVIYAENRSFSNLYGNFPACSIRSMPCPPSATCNSTATARRPCRTLPKIWGGLVPQAQEVDGKRYMIAREPDRRSAQRAVPAGRRAGPSVAERRDHARPVAPLLSEPDADQRRAQRPVRRLGRLRRPGDGALPQFRRIAAHLEHRAAVHAVRQLLHGRFRRLLAEPHLPDLGAGAVLSGRAQQRRPRRCLGASRRRSDRHAAEARAGLAEVGARRPAEIRQRRRVHADGYAVNTMAPPYQPSYMRPAEGGDPRWPIRRIRACCRRRTTQPSATGCRTKGVDWAWYGGAWQYALDHRDTARRPTSSITTSRSTTSATSRRAPRRARSICATAAWATTRRPTSFIADIDAGRLPAVTFYKPQGNLNMHAGYADVESGDRHIANVIEHLQRGPQWENMVVIVTLRRKRRLVGSRVAAEGRPLGSGFAHSGAGRVAVREKGLCRPHRLRHHFDPALHQPRARLAAARRGRGTRPGVRGQRRGAARRHDGVAGSRLRPRREPAGRLAEKASLQGGRARSDSDSDSGSGSGSGSDSGSGSGPGSGPEARAQELGLAAPVQPCSARKPVRPGPRRHRRLPSPIRAANAPSCAARAGPS